MQKKFVITGAASGLGQAMARMACERGHSVTLADIDRAGGEALAAELSDAGQRAHFEHCDVTDAAAWDQLAERANARMGGVDVLVNNAGIATAGALMETDEDEWRRVLEVNLMSVVRGSKAFVPLLLQSHDAHIVNVASFAAIALAPGMISYNVVKAGVLAFSESLRGELEAQGVHVAVLCPSFFKTNLTDSMQGVDPAVRDRIEHWMTRSDFTAEDVAASMFEAIEKRQFLVLANDASRKLYRLRRWFPEFFYRQKIKRARRMFEDKKS